MSQIDVLRNMREESFPRFRKETTQAVNHQYFQGGAEVEYWRHVY